MKKLALATTALGFVAISLACSGGGTKGISLGADAYSATDCPASAVSAAAWSDGTRATLIALHEDDAYSGSDSSITLPMSGHVDGEMTQTEGCWMGGPFVSDAGDSFYFYKGAFTQP